MYGVLTTANHPHVMSSTLILVLLLLITGFNVHLRVILRSGKSSGSGIFCIQHFVNAITRMFWIWRHGSLTTSLWFPSRVSKLHNTGLLFLCH